MRMSVGVALLIAVWHVGTEPASAIAGDGSDARESLSFHNAALYCGWNDYLVREDTPFDFLLVQGEGPFEGRDNRPWNEWLKKARKNKKRVIALLNPQVKKPNGEYYNMYDCPADAASLDALVRVMGEFLDQVDIKELYAVSLAEEHIFWDGRAERLNALYEKLKAKYDVPVYQWYSPSGEGSVPGLNWPNLKADGWLADEYHLDQPQMERAMRGYTVMQKPIIQTIWAGGKGASVPYIPTRFWGQVDVCRKYDIPTSYFTWYGASYPWGFSKEAPASLKRTFETALQAAARSKIATVSNRREWDFVPWTIPTIPLSCPSPEVRTAGFREEYVASRGVRFVNEAEVRGFEHLRWDSSPVELRPRQAGPADARVSFSLESPFEMSELRVQADASVVADRSAVVSLRVVDDSGTVVQQTELAASGTLQLTIPGDKLCGRKFHVVYGLKGLAATAGEVLAGVKSLDVTADLQLPPDMTIVLQADALGQLVYSEELSGMRLYHTAEFKNLEHAIRSPSGLHANVPAGTTLEAVQKFRAHQLASVNRLRVTGHADGVGRAARLGVGVSLNGVDILAQKMSEGSFNGELIVDLSELPTPVQGKEFYVHLFLEGGHGVIQSYAVEAVVVQ